MKISLTDRKIPTNRSLQEGIQELVLLLDHARRPHGATRPAGNGETHDEDDNGSMRGIFRSLLSRPAMLKNPSDVLYSESFSYVAICYVAI